MSFSRHVLELEAQAEVERLRSALLRTVRKTLRRNGAVVGISGGIDSSVVLGLCAHAFGPLRVRAIMMPERDSDPDSEGLAREVAARYGVEPVLEDITGCLDGFACYRRKDEAIQRLFPEYDAARGYRSKITLPPNLLEGDALNVFSLTVLTPDGRAITKQLPAREFCQIVAASNFKQRARMSMLYYHAELNNYAVIGTANKNEHDQGFFVKYGDGGADVRPIAHLYKTQVYQLAEYLGVPDRIRRRVPTTDTYSAPTTQEEFYFRLPFETMDLLWYAMEHEAPVSEVAGVMHLTEQQVKRAYNHFVAKRRATEYLRHEPISLAPVRSAEPQEAGALHVAASPASAG